MTVDEPAALLLLPHLRVQNANAISSPLTWGFPAPTAFTGFVHALSRQLPKRLPIELALGGVGIVSHGFEPQIAGNYVKVFSLTRNPVDKNGESPSFAEEGRAHLEVSLLVEVTGDDVLDIIDDQRLAENLAYRILALAHGMRLAGGSIVPSEPDRAHRPQLWKLPSATEGRTELMRELRRRLLPGFALVSRQDLLAQQLAELREQRPEATPLDAWLDSAALHWDCEAGEDKHGNATVAWRVRTRPGWLVPISVGYMAISPTYEPGVVKNSRDPTVPFCFVESLYSLGQWISPHRVGDIHRLLWHHQADPDAGLYRCINRYASTTETTIA